MADILLKLVAYLIYFSRPVNVFHFDKSKLPTNEGWMPMDTESPHGTELVPLDPNRDDQLFKDVKSKFLETMANSKFSVERIYRVQNLDLHKKYTE